MDAAKEKEKNWTDYLKGLKVGQHSRKMDSVEEMESLSSVGYRLNAQGGGKGFSFSKNYKDLTISITVFKK